MSRIIYAIVFSVILITGSTPAFSQVVITSSDSLICSVTCTTLTATVNSAVSSTSGLSWSDDTWSSPLNLGFTFNFYGANYTQCIVGTNGVVGFNLGNAGAYNSWPISATLANTAAGGGDMRNVIAGVWCDLLLSAGGNVYYSSIGIAPNRKFAITFCADRMYSCTSQWTTAQIILYETSNIIEVHIGRKAACPAWNGGYAETGIVNNSGSASTMAPGPPLEDYPIQWSTYDIAWRFVPNAGGASYSVSLIPYAPVPSTISSTIYWYNATTGAYVGTGTNITVCPTTTTTYKAGVIDCSDTAYGYYTVTMSGAMPPITGSTTLCPGSATPFSDIITGGTWSSSDTTVATISASGMVYGISAGTTDISYSTGSCATGVVVTVSTLSDITGDNTVCAGSTLSLSDATTGGTWISTATGIATVDASGIVTGVAAGTVVISYSIGCVATTTITVTPSPGAGIITGPASVCVGALVTLSDTVSGGAWSISNGNATLSGLNVTGVSQGTDTVSYTVTSVSCGTAVATAIISVDLSPDAGTITGDTGVCAGATTNLSDPATGGAWGSSNSTVATVSAGVVYASSAGTATIGYAVTNACGTASTTKVITVFAVPPITPISGQDTACPGAVFMLSDATPGGHWSNTNSAVLTVNDSGKVTASAAGTTIIIYTIGPNAGGCSSSVNFHITVTAQGNFVVNSSVTPVTCYGNQDGSIHLSIGGTLTYQYLWTSGVSGTVLTGLAPGYDTVRVTSVTTQCVEVHIYHITQPDSLEVTTTTKNDTCDAGKGSASAIITGGTMPYTYHWSDGKTGKDNTGLITGTYTVTVTDSNGCTKSISATVQQDSCGDLRIHNAITPNGDGMNDTWVIEGIENYPTNSVQVFDKWGDMVYSKTNYNNDWNGKGKNGVVPDGTYYYLVKLNTANLKGGQNVWTGYLLIKR